MCEGVVQVHTASVVSSFDASAAEPLPAADVVIDSAHPPPQELEHEIIVGTLFTFPSGCEKVTDAANS